MQETHATLMTVYIFPIKSSKEVWEPDRRSRIYPENPILWFQVTDTTTIFIPMNSLGAMTGVCTKTNGNPVYCCRSSTGGAGRKGLETLREPMRECNPEFGRALKRRPVEPGDDVVFVDWFPFASVRLSLPHCH